MFGFAEYVMPEARVERFRSQQFNFSSEQSFEELGQGEKIVKGFSARLEFHEDVYVAFVARFAAGEGAEHTNLPYAEASYLLAILT